MVERDPSIPLSIPLLNPATRKLIADTIVLLTRDDQVQFLHVLRKLSSLVPYEQGEASKSQLFSVLFPS